MDRADLPVLSFEDACALEAHMLAQPPNSPGFWIRLSKQGAPTKTIGKEEAIESALCCGWIDGQLRKFDEHYFLIRMTPRRPRSRWSAKNRETADRLMRQGRLTPAGSLQIDEAKKDGRWAAAYQSQRKAEPPEDFLKALGKSEKAASFFETLDRANRYAIIYRVNDAKRPETRAKRIAQFVEMLARGETIHPTQKSRA